MPDGDWYTVHVPKHWRGVARRLEDGIGDVRAGDRALRAFTRTIREAAGVPGLAEMADVAQRFAAGETRSAAAELRRIMQLAEQRPGTWELTQIAHSAAESTIVDTVRGQRVADLGAEVLHRFVVRTIESRLCDPARVRLIDKRFGTLEAAHAWQADWLRGLAPQIDKLVASLRKHPTGAGLRAPARLDRRRATADLLNVGIT